MKKTSKKYVDVAKSSLKKKTKDSLKGMLEMQSEKNQFSDDTYNPTDEERHRRKKFLSELDTAVNFRADYDNMFEEYVERYRARPFYYEDGRAGVVLPIGKLIVETAQAQESKNPPSFAYSAADNKEDIKKAQILEFVVKNHVWNREYVNLDTKMDVLNQDKMILGTMYQYIGWRKMYRTRREFVKSEGGAYEVSCKQVLHYDDIVVDNIFPQDIWLHPLARTVAESPWAYVRKRYDAETFLETFSDTRFFKNIKFVKAGAFFNGWDHGAHVLWRNLNDQKDVIIVLEKWNKITDEVIIYANDVEIYYGPNPYDHKELPLTDFRNRLQFNTYLGESEMDRIGTICDALNAFINIAIDKEKRASTGINLLDNNMSDFDDTAVMFSSTHATRVENPKDSFVHYEMPGMSASTSNMIQMLMDFLVYATGIDFRQITDLSSSTKATVAALRKEIAQQRINLNVMRNENCGIKRQGWLLGKLVQQYYPVPLLEEATGDNLSTEKEGEEKGEGKNKLKYRKIKVRDYDLSEEPIKGEYTAKSLRLKGKKDGKVSFFEARPEYLGIKGDIDVKVVPGSTMAAIAELQKNKAQEYVRTAMEVVKPPSQEGGLPEPYLSVKYGLEKLVKAWDYDVDKAFDTSDTAEETVAMKEAQPVLDQFSQALGMPQFGATPQQATMPGQPPMPPNPPPNIAGVTANTPELKELANEMGVANRVKNGN